MAYFINLFTEETWREIREHGWEVTGHTPRLRNRDKIGPEDVFLCYMTGVSAFVGALQVTGRGFEVGPDGKRIWQKELFPLRYPIELSVRVPITDGVSLAEARGHSADEGFWKWVFRNSGNEIPEEEAQWILEQLKQRPQLAPEAPEPALTLDLEKQVSGLDASAAGRPREHSKAQLELAALGERSGYDVWIARNDRSVVVDGTKLGDLSIEELPGGLPPQFMKTVELIDVLWVQRDRNYVAAFEIETTTPIFTGMLRMADLRAAIPNISIPLYIFAPEARRARVFEQLTRPLFRYALDPPLEDVCSYVPLESFFEECEKYSDTPGIDGNQLIEGIAERAQ